jgi:hypothetical protein
METQKKEQLEKTDREKLTIGTSTGIFKDLDSKLKKLKTHAGSAFFSSGPYTQHHEEVLFDIKVLESLKRLNS